MARARALSRAQVTIQCEAEASATVARVHDSAVESGQRAWQATRSAEAAKRQAREEASHAKARVLELEAALMHQASTHTWVVDTMTSERDRLRAQVMEVKEGEAPLLASYPRKWRF